jgi:tRNA 2-(methylsulfanyl)-N6-isopentenyladenosine37 hydroxylase
MEIIDKTTLGLHLPTDPRWTDIAEKNIADVLIDHAWCEQKAATNGISLIIRFAEKKELVEMLTPLVAEEWSHFRRVLAEMKKRNIDLKVNRKDIYVIELFKLERKGGNIDQQLMDKLLISALIEARSAERFKQLSLHIADKELSDFYYELMVSEAGHYRIFIDLAKNYMPENVVNQRWQELLKEESQIMLQIGIRTGKFH